MEVELDPGAPTMTTTGVLDPELLRLAMEPTIVVGRGALASEIGRIREPWALVTQAEPRRLLPVDLVARACAVRDVTSLAVADLAGLVNGLPEATRAVVGFGGGTALDAAKWCAWRRGLPLLLAPGILSVDAAVTNTIAVRDGGSVVYRGFVVADRIVLDPDLVTRAPARLNRAGVGDLLSIHTGLHDWRLGASEGQIAYDVGIAAAAASVLQRVEALAPEIGAVTPVGLEGMLRAYAEVNALCLRAGHSGPEEGSEHYFGYRLEAVAGRSFVHGELIGLGTVLMATLQGNDPSLSLRILDRCSVDWRPAALGVERAIVREALVGLPSFVRAHGLPYSVVDRARLDQADVDALLDRVLGSSDSPEPASVEDRHVS